VKRYKLRIPAPGGQIETVVDDPEGTRGGLALIAHPHPLHGGTFDNKVVTTLARAAVDAGWVAVRSNFRGVGASDGVFDAGRGETDDLLAVAHFVEKNYPGLPWVLTGFSFGAFVQHRLAARLPAKRLILVAPAVTMYDFDPVPPGTEVIFGDADELIAPAAIAEWAATQGIAPRVVNNAGHFFHGKLRELRAAFAEACPC
jgi:alpha/beta superfamily hydrolase